MPIVSSSSSDPMTRSCRPDRRSSRAVRRQIPGLTPPAERQGLSARALPLGLALNLVSRWRTSRAERREPFVLPDTRNEAKQLRFRVGHPLPDVVYVGIRRCRRSTTLWPLPPTDVRAQVQRGVDARRVGRPVRHVPAQDGRAAVVEDLRPGEPPGSVLARAGAGRGVGRRSGDRRGPSGARGDDRAGVSGVHDRAVARDRVADRRWARKW